MIGYFFIDWEYSGLNDPLFDIATIIEEAHLSKEAADFLLETYCNQTNKYHKTEFQIAHKRLKSIVLPKCIVVFMDKSKRRTRREFWRLCIKTLRRSI